jgi:hypothetical protein
MLVQGRRHAASYRGGVRQEPHTHVLFLYRNLKYSRQVMGSVTGIELDGDSCVLVRVRPGGDVIRLMALGGTWSPSWEPALPLAENLRRARLSGSFPKHAAVVAWDVHESASNSDRRSAGEAPLAEAGFAVGTVVSPTAALCALAKRRQKIAGREAEVWLALNRRHVAMAIVEDGRLLFSRRFDWHYSPGATQRAELLQRYLLVAHLAPEVRHGIDVVHAEHGTRVNTIVTCGDLPDLRSLTMPLTEELDIEVETLDTLDGIVVEKAAAADAIAEQAPAIRLASAVAAASVASSSGRWRFAAAAVVLFGILAGVWTMVRSFSGSPGPTERAEPSQQSNTAPVEPAQPAAGAAKETAAPDRTASQGLKPLESPKATTGRTPTPTAPAAAPAVRRPTPQDAPLPVVNSILVAPERRLAVLNGEIVREGDAVGPRVLIRIEPRAVVLREPSGREVTVPIRRKLN